MWFLVFTFCMAQNGEPGCLIAKRKEPFTSRIECRAEIPKARQMLLESAERLGTTLSADTYLCVNPGGTDA